MDGQCQDDHRAFLLEPRNMINRENGLQNVNMRFWDKPHSALMSISILLIAGLAWLVFYLGSCMACHSECTVRMERARL